ncbi:MAG TPA: DUF1549 domain-containing protein, partial [Lacipirellulaceae bacterium]|nr:DUF1549 domain-containing protein [Lacipirellulaceae bacterium]
MRVCVAISIACASLFASAHVACGVTRPPVSYDRDIRPILSDKCYRCHGPDAESRQADLRLDAPKGLSKKIVVAGKPEKSELIRRISSTDDDERMPPPDSKLSLTAPQKELLRRWVAEGATFTEHWSFLPLPDKIAVPAVHNGSWPQGPIDRFVLAKLETEKLRPALPADRLRLLRRVTLDLTGLPPTANECREFESVNPRDLDRAYETAVDRLLASPAFGE